MQENQLDRDDRWSVAVTSGEKSKLRRSNAGNGAECARVKREGIILNARVYEEQTTLVAFFALCSNKLECQRRGMNVHQGIRNLAKSSN